MQEEQKDKNRKKKTTSTTKKKPDYIGHRERLRARFLADIGRSMPDYELLEILLTYALPRRDVKPIAKNILREYLNLANVLVAPPAELMKICGIGSNAATLCAVVHACANKISWENLDNKDVPIMSSSKRVSEYCRTCIGYSNQEQLLIIYLDIHGRYLRDSIEQVGTLSSVAISPREIINKALMYGAAGIIISHNHPSGDCTPSRADVEMTKQLKESLKTVQIELVDHIIISKRTYYSMRDSLPFMKKFR